MEEKTKKNSQIARLLAVLALIGTILIVIVAISGATGGDDGGSSKKANPGKQQTQNKPKTKKKKYEVEEGDTLTTISNKTGISVDRLEKLNPDLDPQALQVGQELKLR
jgi:LysM repeat protein